MAKDKTKLAILLIRTGLAAVFLYAAVAAILDPFSWIGFFPAFLREILPDSWLIWSHSASEIILAAWLLSGKYSFYAALIAAISILTIIIFNFGTTDIIFRDIGLLFAAAALAVLSRPSSEAL